MSFISVYIWSKYKMWKSRVNASVKWHLRFSRFWGYNPELPLLASISTSILDQSVQTNAYKRPTSLQIYRTAEKLSFDNWFFRILPLISIEKIVIITLRSQLVRNQYSLDGLGSVWAFNIFISCMNIFTFPMSWIINFSRNSFKEMNPSSLPTTSVFEPSNIKLHIF